MSSFFDSSSRVFCESKGGKQSQEKELLIVFVKNPVLGKVKTRLAKSIGDEGAFQVYKYLVEITERETENVKAVKYIYFSDVIIDEKWQKTSKFIQKGEDLGEKMQKSVEKGLKDDFEKIVLIGSDLPDISAQLIENAFDALNQHEVVFGPAEDGGYYLVGMTKQHFCIFQNKMWSTDSLLETTLAELTQKKISYSLLETLNDIDTIEDLEQSSIYNDIKEYY